MPLRLAIPALLFLLGVSGFHAEASVYAVNNNHGKEISVLNPSYIHPFSDAVEPLNENQVITPVKICKYKPALNLLVLKNRKYLLCLIIGIAKNRDGIFLFLRNLRI